MSALYTYEYGLMVQCNLVIRKVLYTVKNRSCVGSRLSDIIVLVFHTFICICMLIYCQMDVYGLQCLDKVFYGRF